MRTVAVVVKSENGKALISVDRKTACDGCHNRKGCKAAEGMSIDFSFSKKKLETTATDPLGCLPGDRVIVESDSGEVIGGAALVFLLPLAVALLGFILGSNISEAYGYIFAVAGMLLSFLFVRIITEMPSRRRERIKIVKKLDGCISEISSEGNG